MGEGNHRQEKHYFVAYSRENSDFTLGLADSLRRTGLELWIDRDIGGGERWDDSIEAAISRCRGLVVILTPQAIRSNNVKDEVNFALDKGKRIIPVPASKCEIPLRLRRVQYVDFTEGYDFALASLLARLRASDSGDERDPQSAEPTGDMATVQLDPGHENDTIGYVGDCSRYLCGKSPLVHVHSATPHSPLSTSHFLLSSLCSPCPLW